MPAGSRFWIEKGMLSDTVRNVDTDGDGKVDHFCFTVRNQFLHPNHPLGWIRKLTVTVDGRTIPGNQAHFVVRGQRISVEDVPTITDIWWYMREEAEIYVASNGLSAGRHRVTCTFEICAFIHAQLYGAILDKENIYPRLTANMSSEMEAS